MRYGWPLGIRFAGLAFLSRGQIRLRTNPATTNISRRSSCVGTPRYETAGTKKGRSPVEDPGLGPVPPSVMPLEPRPAT
jgi:hypothetical protein